MSRRSSKVSRYEQEDLMYDCKAAYVAVLGDVNTDITSKQDLMEALEMTGRNPSQKALKSYWPSDRRYMSFDEFVDTCRKEHPTSNEELLSAFQKIDINGDGFITVDELHRIMTKKGEKMTKDEVREIIEDIDENGDGKIDYGEYCNMMNKTVMECKSFSRKLLEKKEKKKKSEFSDSKRAGDGGMSGSQLSVKSNSSQRRERQSSRPSSAQRSMGRRDSAEWSIDGKNQSLNNKELKSEEEIKEEIIKVDEPLTSCSQRSNASVTFRSQKSDEPVTPRSQRSFKSSSGSLFSCLKSVDTDSTVHAKTTQGLNKSSRKPEADKQNLSRSQNEISSEEKVEEDDNQPLTSRSQRSIKSSSGSVFSFMKSTEDDSAVALKSSQQSLNSPDKSGEMTSCSRSSLRSADRISGSRRSLLSIGDKDLITPVPVQRKSLSRSLFPELQDDLPKPSPRNKREGVISHGPASRLSPLSEPRNLKEWTHTSMKGAFFIDDGTIVCHQYELELTEQTQVWITIQPTIVKSMIIGGEGRPIDTALLIHNDRNNTMEVTEKRDSKGRFGIRTTLKPGTYSLIPFTTGCHLKARTGSKFKEAPLIKQNREGKTVITKAFRQALKEIFDMCDLDGNGLMSKEEFSWFNWRTSEEKVSEEEWKVVEENVELDGGELTPEGFIKLNELEAEDGEGDTDDLWVTLGSMGYNKELFIDESCPFKLDVYTEDCDEAEVTVTNIEPLNKKIIIQSIMEKGERTKVKGMRDLEMYTYSNATRASIVLENTSHSKVKVEVDCSNSKNCVSNRDTLSERVTVLANSQEIGHHLLPADESLDWTVRTSEIIHK